MNYKLFNSILTCSLLGLLFTACQQENNKKVEKTEKTEEKKIVNTPPIEIDKKYNDVARILAGIEVESSSEFFEITQTEFWKAYKKASDQSWQNANDKRFNAVKEWAKQELGTVNSMDGDLCYPFSGPDFFYAYKFFPNANNYHLFALEPAGDVSFLKNNDIKWESYCNNVAQTIDDFILGGFFHTKHMKIDMTLNGALPAILAFIVRSGHQIAKVEHVKIDNDGKIIISDSSKSSVRIDFVEAESGKLKSVFYHSCDLSDYGIITNPALLKYMDQIPNPRTFTKSASYLMHRPNFEKVRSLLLKKSLAIFQDDTAIPYKYYDPKVWNIQLYGKHIKPIQLFATRLQNDLVEAYKDPKVKTLPFSLGYHSKNEGDNMMLSIKK
jgi:hypothetical protein